jgi:F420 biosynthesis protein FbiB-like protein
MAAAWRRDLARDGTTAGVVDRRLSKSDALLGTAPMLIVPAVRMRGSHQYADERRALAEEEMFLLSAGAGIQNLLLGLHAQGLASCWVSSTLFCKDETRRALGLEEDWIPLGAIAVGRHPEGASPPARPSLDVEDHVRFEEDLRNIDLTPSAAAPTPIPPSPIHDPVFPAPTAPAPAPAPAHEAPTTPPLREEPAEPSWPNLSELAEHVASEPFESPGTEDERNSDE